MTNTELDFLMTGLASCILVNRTETRVEGTAAHRGAVCGVVNEIIIDLNVRRARDFRRIHDPELDGRYAHRGRRRGHRLQLFAHSRRQGRHGLQCCFRRSHRCTAEAQNLFAQL